MSAPSRSLATDTCKPPSPSSAGGNASSPPAAPIILCPLSPQTTAYLALPWRRFIKQHLVQLHVHALIRRADRGGIRLFDWWRRSWASVGVSDAPVAAVGELSACTLSLSHCHSTTGCIRTLFQELQTLQLSLQHVKVCFVCCVPVMSGWAGLCSSGLQDKLLRTIAAISSFMSTSSGLL